MSTCTVDEPRVVWRESEEFIDVEVTADVVIDTQPVHMSFVPYPYTWIAAAWQGTPGNVRTASVKGTDANLPEEDTEVFVRITDTSEKPIRSAGPLYRP